MSVGGIRGGGKNSGPKGPKGAGAKGGASKVSAGSFGKVDGTETLVGASGAAGSSEVSGTRDPVVEGAAAVARALKNGEIATRQEAARQLVAGILKERLKTKSQALESRIAEQIEEDPHLSATLDRILKRGG